MPYVYVRVHTYALFSVFFSFVRHLRDKHCTREGGSFVCRYGYKGVCASLPLDGVSDRDYEAHVMKYHMKQVKEPEEWSLFMAAQNLPAVLNDPSRGKQSNIFTKKWGDSFVEKAQINASPLLPDITYEYLENYIRQISKRYRRHLRLNQNIQLRERSQLPSTSSSVSDASVTNANQFSSSHNKNVYNELCDANLENIPQIFTKANLDFNHPDTFEAVFPGVNEEDSQKSGRLLQEKLSHYLDIVEMQIAKQVINVKQKPIIRRVICYLLASISGVRKIVRFLPCDDISRYDYGANVRCHQKCCQTSPKDEIAR